MMILTKRSKKIIQIAAVAGTAGVLLSGLSAAMFQPAPTQNIAPAGQPISSQTLEVQTDASGEVVQP